MERFCRGRGRRVTTYLSISSQVHPKNLMTAQRALSSWLQGTYRAAWSLPLTFFARARSLPAHVEGTFTASFNPIAIAKAAGRHSGCCEPKGDGHNSSSYCQICKTWGWSQQGLSEIRAAQGRGWPAQRKSPLPPLPVALQPRRGIQMSQLGNFPSEAPCKMKSTVPCSDSCLLEGFSAKVKGFLKMG